MVALTPQSASALPGNSQSWVSPFGNDAAACTAAAACATLGVAIAATAAGGTVNCGSSGNFYPFQNTLTITKSITINCKGVIAVFEGQIVVAAGATDKVVIQGLSMDGACNVCGAGVQVNSGGFVYIIDTTISNGYINGVRLLSTTPNARVFIQNSTIQGSFTSGVSVAPGGSTVNIVSIVNSLIDSNGSFAVKLAGAGAILGLQSSILNGSPAAISLSNGAQAYTVGGTNSVNGTFTFTGTIPLN
jgi:hypothetical protein